MLFLVATNTAAGFPDENPAKLSPSKEDHEDDIYSCKELRVSPQGTMPSSAKGVDLGISPPFLALHTHM